MTEKKDNLPEPPKDKAPVIVEIDKIYNDDKVPGDQKKQTLQGVARYASNLADQL